jgi:tRNA A-37 threonylcarbamoyl transferase component Bud32/tetratricopeptide (TPR) repeat protein
MPEPQHKKLGKYEIRKELGKGAMGVVYLAYDPVLEREVALKVMASTIVSDKELKERFEREAKAVARLQHPNIVTVYDLGYDQEGSPFIAMELLKGNDLEHHMRSQPPTFVEKIEIIMQVCRGLSHAHSNGIVHRDIKPANIFVTASKDVKIMDFGVARWMQSSQTQTGAILGTADYMSPEQIRGHKVDGRSDIFSVGVILYRLLTNKKPFKGENIQSVFFKILNSDAPELKLPDGSTIPELQTIVDRAMAKDAGARYATANDMAEDLNQFLHKYHGAVSEDTVFDTAFDPGVAADHDTSGRGRRATTMRPETGSGRIGGTSPGGVSRTFRPSTGTVAPPTAMGATAGGTVPQARPTAVVPPTRIARGPRPVVQPERKSPWLFMVILVLVLGGAGAGGYWYINNQPPPTTTDLESRFEFATTAFEAGRLSQAFEAVENILAISPDNQQALDLREKIREALAQQEQETPAPATTTVPQPVTPSGPTPAQRAQQVREDVLMALASNDVARARELISQGERLTPSDSRWAQLKEQLAGKERELRQQGIAQQRDQLIARYLRQAADAVAAEDYDKAIQAYDAILEHDSNHQGAITGKTQALNLKRQLELEQQRQAELRQAAMAFNRDIIESGTEYTAPPGKGEGPKGFEAGGGVNVKRATSAPTFPAAVIIELNPTNAQPGQPYVVRVRLNNEGNKAITVKYLELISSYGGKSIGKGQRIPPKVQRISPKATALLHEVQSTWVEEQNKGSITAIVTLVGDATLTKVISW